MTMRAQMGIVAVRQAWDVYCTLRKTIHQHHAHKHMQPFLFPRSTLFSQAQGNASISSLCLRYSFANASPPLALKLIQ